MKSNVNWIFFHDEAKFHFGYISSTFISFLILNYFICTDNELAINSKETNANIQNLYKVLWIYAINWGLPIY